MRCDWSWRAWQRTVLLITLMLAGMPAQATDYVAPFDGRSPVPLGCLTLLGSTTCIFTITLIIGDTLKLGSGVVVNGSINSSTGSITMGDNVTVAGKVFTSTGNITMGLNGNVGGKVESSTGNINLGDGAVVGLNVFSTTGAITLGTNGIVNTSIQSSTGPITLGDNVYVKQGVNSTTGPLTIKSGRVVGNVGATTGFINIGDGTRIDGSITHTEVGNIVLGQGVIVKGGIASADTTTVVGDGSKIAGSINNSSTGNVTLQKNVQVGGNVTVITGSANIGYGSQVLGMVTAITGNVKVGDYARVVGIATATTGDVDIGDYGQVCGYVTVTTGAITIGAHGRVGSYVTVTTGKVALGAVTVGDYGQVGGYIAVTTGSIIFGTFGQVGSYIEVTTGDTSKGAVTFGDNGRVGGYIAITTGMLVTGINFRSSDASLIIPSTCLAITPPLVAAITAASFDALENGITWNPIKGAHNALYTKLAGTPFSFDIVALKTDRTLESAYVAVGAIAKNVKLELFDEMPGVACGAYTSAVTSQMVKAAFTSTSSGRAPMTDAFTVPDAHSSMLVRISECATSACNIPFTSVACSSDRFSVRPPALTLSATPNQIIKAGAEFTLTSGPSFAGRLTLDPARLTTSQGKLGDLTPSTLAANAAAKATYSEVGDLTIGTGAYRDDSFTGIDNNPLFGISDCIISTADSAYLSDTLIGGKYGCSIGNKPLTLARFIPDHFSTVLVPDTETVKNAAMPCGAGLICPPGPPAQLPGFIIYSGQPFALTVTALNANGKPTLNYSGTLARDVALGAWSAAGGMTAAGPTGSTLDNFFVISSIFAQGTAITNVAYTFPARYPAISTLLTAPTDIYLRADETGSNADGVTSLRSGPSAPGPVSLEAGIKVVSGRLQVANNYGSELLTVPIKVHAQYWNGTRFVNSTTDQKTSFSNPKLTFSNCKKNLSAGGTCIPLSITAPVSAINGAMKDGEIRLLLAAPRRAGSVDLNINMFDWLPSTIARIGVGIYKAGPIIYMREAY